MPAPQVPATSPPAIPRRFVARILRGLLWLLLASFGALLVLLMAFENSLIYVPSKYPDGDWTLPDKTVEDVNFTAADGTPLHGWYFPHPNPRGYILFSHGNGGNVADWSTAANYLRERQKVSVFLYDYRGYGRSGGSPNEAGIQQDARAARAWLAKRAAIPEQQIIQYGQSLGGAVAVDLAAADGARGLVLVRTFSSIREVAAQKFPWIPVRLVMRHKLDSISKIGNFHAPVLLNHGEDDVVIPFEFGRKLFDAANEPKRLVVDPGVNHNDPLSRSFHEALDDYLKTLP